MIMKYSIKQEHSISGNVVRYPVSYHPSHLQELSALGHHSLALKLSPFLAESESFLIHYSAFWTCQFFFLCHLVTPSFWSPSLFPVNHSQLMSRGKATDVRRQTISSGYWSQITLSPCLKCLLTFRFLKEPQKNTFLQRSKFLVIINWFTNVFPIYAVTNIRNITPYCFNWPSRLDLFCLFTHQTSPFFTVFKLRPQLDKRLPKYSVFYLV